MEKALMIMGKCPEDIASGLLQFAEQYKARHKEAPPQLSFDKEKMTVGQGANYIDVSYPTLCKWINEGKIPVHGKGRTRFLLRSEFIEAYKQLK